MEVLREVAERHDFVCLLHEKPFAGVNGSGKHNNWAIAGPDGKNWLTPGDNPHENAKFLVIICALLMAVDKHADLLRAAVATAGNDHRLGANEAPPAIISVFLGEQLTDIIAQIEKGGAKSSKKGGEIRIGVSALPTLPRDATDRNRTSPFAFTGNKFEFRAVGSSQNCAGANVVLNTIVAEAIDEICSALESTMAAGNDLNSSLQKVLSDIVKKHKRIIFNGDNYTNEWKAEARKRGLPNLLNTPDALKALVTDKAIKLFGRYEVLSERELKSRYDVYHEAYEKTIKIEARCALKIVTTQIIPTILKYQTEIASAVAACKTIRNLVGVRSTSAVMKKYSAEVDVMIKATANLERLLTKGHSAELLASMSELRSAVDSLERMTPKKEWPLPSYAEMLFRF